MSTFLKIDVVDNDLLATIQGFLKGLLESEKLDGLMVPWHLPGKNNIMPTLITDPDALDQADPLAPCFPVNAAKMAARLTRNPSGKKVGLVMRPCEIRAFVELVKLKQARWDDIVIISLDCLGAFNNTDYNRYVNDDPLDDTRTFYTAVLKDLNGSADTMGLASACQVCDRPVSAIADICIQLFGLDCTRCGIVEAATPKAEDLFSTLAFEATAEPVGRKDALASLVSDRTEKQDQMFKTTAEATSSVEKLSLYLSRCVNCYNCRVACPVCYCKECVFATDVFDHDAFQYMDWAERKGKVKMPTDTDFFHLTRMAHISLSCVGCGQCSNACPNDIPLMELFTTIANNSQKAFDYEAGRSVDEPIPLSVFNDKEYEEEVGITTKSS